MINIISIDQKRKFLSGAKKRLLSSKNRTQIELTREWIKTFPDEPGVYCLFVNNQLKYVGETGSIKGRISDLLNSMHHTCRRTLGEVNFSHIKGFVKATSKQKFPQHIETLLEAWMKEHLSVSYLQLHIGRKEFEEWLQEDMIEIKFLNKRKRRSYN